MSKIYPNFDFKLLHSPDFKEDSVREVLILPILQALGYDNSQIVRSKAKVPKNAILSQFS